MATYRGQGSDNYSIGAKPPYVSWTVVRGDTASFRVYVTDDNKDPLNIPDWSIKMQIKRPTAPVVPGVITDNASLILNLIPAPDADDQPGEFTVSLTAEESILLDTGDRFDIQMSNTSPASVWTVAQGTMIMIDSVTE